MAKKILGKFSLKRKNGTCLAEDGQISEDFLKEKRPQEKLIKDIQSSSVVDDDAEIENQEYDHIFKDANGKLYSLKNPKLDQIHAELLVANNAVDYYVNKANNAILGSFAFGGASAMFAVLNIADILNGQLNFTSIAVGAAAVALCAYSVIRTKQNYDITYLLTDHMVKLNDEYNREISETAIEYQKAQNEEIMYR